MNYESPELDQLFTALAKAQGEMKGAVKDSSNPFFKSRYADFNSIMNACRDSLAKYGLNITQSIRERENGDVYIYTRLGHSSGQWTSSSMPVRIKGDGKNNELQALGSTLSYLKRYCLAALVGVATADEDDDGNASTGYKAPQPKEAAVAQIPCITPVQANEIRSLIALCDADFTTKLMGYLNNNGMPNIDRMFVSFFDPVKKRIQKYLADGEAKAHEGG